MSDLHFGHGGPGYQWNQVRVLDELLSDVGEVVRLKKAPAPGFIFVTGDVAFSGGARTPATGDGEYALATTWLTRLCGALHVPKERVFVVPGNHDVDRGVDRDRDIAGMVELARLGVDGHQLDDALSDATGTERLRSRLARYLAFAAGFGPTKGASTPAPLWWEHREPLAEGLTLRLCGLNTALLAAKDDDRGKLRVGQRQLAELLRVTAPTEVTVVLGHHPAGGGWLADEKDLRGALDERAVAYLSGHVHEARSVQVHKGAGEGCLHVSAGAAHAEAAPADAPPTSHGYNVGALVVLTSGELAVRIWPRRWSLTRPRFEVDTGNTRKNQDYAEHRLQVCLPPPSESIEESERSEGSRLSAQVAAVPTAEQALHQLMAELFTLPKFRQWLKKNLGVGVPFESVRGVTRSTPIEQVYLNVWFSKFEPRAPRFVVDVPIEMRVALGPQRHGAPTDPLSEDLLGRLRRLSQIDVWVQCADADVTPCDGTLHLPWPTNVLSFELTPRRPGGLRIVVVLLIHNQPVHRLEREVQVQDRRDRGERWG